MPKRTPGAGPAQTCPPGTFPANMHSWSATSSSPATWAPARRQHGRGRAVDLAGQDLVPACAKGPRTEAIFRWVGAPTAGYRRLHPLPTKGTPGHPQPPEGALAMVYRCFPTKTCIPGAFPALSKHFPVPKLTPGAFPVQRGPPDQISANVHSWPPPSSSHRHPGVSGAPARTRTSQGKV